MTWLERLAKSKPSLQGRSRRLQPTSLSVSAQSSRDYRVVSMFAKRPWQRDLPSWYPPISQFNTILLRLRRLGLYTDEHLVGVLADLGQSHTHKHEFVEGATKTQL